MARMSDAQRQTRDRIIRDVKSDANAPKRALIGMRDELLATPGCRIKAEALDNIIARLEAWQNG